MSRTPALAVFALIAALLSSVTVSAPVADAQQTVEIFEPRPANTWGVAGLDPGSGNFRYYSPIFDIEQIGDTVYAGGKFLEVTNGATSIDQPHLASFRSTDGVHRAGFTPDLDWSVFALAAHDGRLFVGGEFPTVDDDADQAGFAALDPQTGRLDPTFGVSIGTNNGAQPRVHALEVADGHLYLAGSFSWIEGSDGQRVNAARLARVDATTGVVDASWRPIVQAGSVWSLAADPANDRVLFGGLFRVVNGEATAAFAIVDDQTGALTDYDRMFGLTYFDQGGTNYDFASAIAVDDNRVVVGGQVHRLVLADSDLKVFDVYLTNRFDAANGGRGGDIQAIEIHDGTAYVACHCWGQINHQTLDLQFTDDVTDVRSTYAVDLASGDLVESFQPDLSGSSGPWALHIDDRGCLWSGTDATQAGQRAAYGLIQSCPTLDVAAGATVSMRPDAESPEDAASFAIDGDLRSNRVASSGFARSAEAATPSLDIDLGRLYDVDSVTIWMPTDRVDPGLLDLHLWTSADPLPSHGWSALRADPAVTETVRAGNHGGKRSITIDLDRPTRYLRVEADYRAVGTGRLVVTEVTVDGDPIDAPPAVDLDLRSTLQTRERIVLRWEATPITVLRDGVEIGTDADGWFTDLGLTAGTSYSYEIRADDGRTDTLTISTNP